MRALVSGSLAMRRPANVDPLSRPSSPPKKSPPAAKSVYVATSPSVDGLSSGVMSGIGSAERQLVSQSRHLSKIGIEVEAATETDIEEKAGARRHEGMDRRRVGSVGRIKENGVISPVLPPANWTCVGRSAARKAAKYAARLARRRTAR